MRLDRILRLMAVTVPPFLFMAACGNQPSEDTATPTVALADTITTEALVAHAQALERISLSHPLSRSSASPGYVQAMDYIKGSLALPGLTLWEQRFEYRYFQETKDPILQMISPEQAAYLWKTDYRTLRYSGAGDVTANVAFVTPLFPPDDAPDTSTDGCEAADFQGIDVAGKIAVIQRGACGSIEKVSNAKSRGAVAVLIFNEGQEGRTDVLPGGISGDAPPGIPVLGIRYELGKALHDQFAAGAVTTLRIVVTGTDAILPTYNLFADTASGRDDQVIVIGAHLDSIPGGPGMNDNGSGAVALLEVSRQIEVNGYTPRNKIRFAWWGAEEDGALGSSRYLDTLSPLDLRSIAMYLNVDCIASPNFVRGVDDGDLSDTRDARGSLYLQTPEGSGAIEQVLLDYFHAKNLPTKPIPLSGGTDYLGFARYGIPFGGLFTELGGMKTEAEAALFGGTAGEPYDSCYHAACDSLGNMNTQILTENTRAIAHLAQSFGNRNVTALFDAPPVSGVLSGPTSRTR